MEIEESLVKYGLSEKEARVYLVLLRLNSALASEIADKTEFPRTLIYDIMEKLIQKGLASFNIKSGKKHFMPASPEKLIKNLKEKEQIIKNILPELIEIKSGKEEKKPRIEIYEGREGIKTLLEELLKSKEILGYGAVGKFEELLQFYFPHFIKRRIKNKIKARLIFNESKTAREKARLPLTEVKILKKEFESPQFVHIYEDKVMIIVFSIEPYAILIKDRIINKSFRQYFELLWKLAKK